MSRALLAAASLVAIAAPMPAFAQETETPLEVEEPVELADLTDKLSDPERQREVALMARAISEVLLDLPVAPLMEAMGQIAGEEAPMVEPGTTLRSLAPQAGRVPEEIERNLPRAMDAVSAMAGAAEIMLPQLRELAQRLEETIPQDR
ncbi:hypothetical protein [Qipengyuania psychrotolerans]|uniref:DUF2059 domain-containing protein n=1 Tax=Qipengyuania psychrotolerans TaxID=2867238 RepID=A0ABX8ZG88_9SPHN|nr:hypothetical protein [Qipengyuania psychrotolerans]QZD86758.1 hypothetical protein K3166_11195 [Qipengyuania psychrotolerans]